MLANARRMNADVPNAEFVQNGGVTLASVADRSIDLVYSRIVLQHVSRRAAIRSYLREFARVLADGGLLCFQLPSHIPARHRLQPRPRLYGVLRRLGVPTDVLYQRLHLQPIRMRFLPAGEVRALLEGEGLRVLDVETVPVSGILSSTYYATRG
jgi:SAM-dependent methyltransferase